MKKRVLPGINIQFPISRLILDGKKTVETRTYRLPEKYVGVELAMIETPGKSGQFTARIVAVVKFGIPFQYSSKRAFRRDEERHCVIAGSNWDWTDKAKWGWPVEVVERLDQPKPLKKSKGIRFTTAVAL